MYDHLLNIFKKDMNIMALTTVITYLLYYPFNYISLIAFIAIYTIGALYFLHDMKYVGSTFPNKIEIYVFLEYCKDFFVTYLTKFIGVIFLSYLIYFVLDKSLIIQDYRFLDRYINLPSIFKAISIASLLVILQYVYIGMIAKLFKFVLKNFF